MRRERCTARRRSGRAKRHIARRHKAGLGAVRGARLVLLATAVLVTVAMFRALYIVMG
jgi:hypothetical protein